MKNLVSALLLSAAIFSSCATTKPADVGTQQTLQDLKKYGLVVWLPDSKRQIEYFKSKGWHKAAAKEQAEAEKQNRDLVRYYNTHFHFCKVHFYYTSLEEDFKNKLPVLLNAEMKPDPSIPLPEKVIVGGFFFKDDQEHFPFPKRHFRVENSKIRMKLRSEAWRPWWVKKPTRERDIIRLNQKLMAM